MIADSFGRYAVETVRDHALDPRSRCSGRLRRSDAPFQGQDGFPRPGRDPGPGRGLPARTRSRTRAPRPGRDPVPGRGSRPGLTLPARATLPAAGGAPGPARSAKDLEL